MTGEIDALARDAARYLAAAHQVAEAQFGAETVREVPLLVTQTATLMAAIAQIPVSEDM